MSAGRTATGVRRWARVPEAGGAQGVVEYRASGGGGIWQAGPADSWAITMPRVRSTAMARFFNRFRGGGKISRARIDR